MTPVQTAIREQSGRVRPYSAADALLAPLKDVLREIVVDWQLPTDQDSRRG